MTSGEDKIVPAHMRSKLEKTIIQAIKAKPIGTDQVDDIPKKFPSNIILDGTCENGMNDSRQMIRTIPKEIKIQNAKAVLKMCCFS